MPPGIPAGLHIVATPIGNAADITLRALDVLRGADLIACEDTRVTGNLLARYEIGTRRLAYNDHNAERVRPVLLERLSRGERIALVSDAGTPLVSDPGYKLVRAAIAEDLPVTIVPGASAPLAALALSGLPSDRFLFAGFLPSRSAARRRELAELAAVPATLILFESARRLGEALADMAAVLGGRPATAARGRTQRF
jgi:16S rRNA (cytidine1402-2'-O)-methyltransferase